ncbi:hypothetical protein ABIA35_003403 [Catenulispora sp. MAP12-49]|uniref:hypothetical protein n=1 Tax=unclassified Catenulispora TaxID=414885 RepID=UPI0035122195
MVQLAADGAELSRVTFCWDGPRLAEQSESGPDGTVRTVTWDYDPGSFRPATQRRRELLADADQSLLGAKSHLAEAGLGDDVSAWEEIMPRLP